MNGLVRKSHTRSTWKKITIVLMSVVVFATTYALILPAITKETTTFCGKEEHAHDEGGM